MKYFLEISYLGKNYCGWQIQPNAITIQEELEKAFFLVFSEKITINGSSRTDTGVHSRQQFAHFQTETEIENPELLVNRLNKILPQDISIKNIYYLSEDAHSRFDAVSRKYIYRIIHKKDPFYNDIAALIFKKPDLELLNKCCGILKKHTDFEAFSKVKTDVKTFDCQILEAFWIYNEDILELHIKANRFLRGMVRAIVGTQLLVGFGKISLEDFERIILSKKRENAGMAAKALGLTLEMVNYPEGYFQNDMIIRKIIAKDIEKVKSLFTEYQEYLGISLCFQDFQKELDELPGKYAEPEGSIWIAEKSGVEIGCVALRKIEEGVCEMKRLYVKPEFHGLGIGRKLIEICLSEAKLKGYLKMKLDTLKRLETAVKSYQKFGFELTQPYNYNPEEDILYFEKEL